MRRYREIAVCLKTSRSSCRAKPSSHPCTLRSLRHQRCVNKMKVDRSSCYIDTWTTRQVIFSTNIGRIVVSTVRLPNLPRDNENCPTKPRDGRIDFPFARRRLTAKTVRSVCGVRQASPRFRETEGGHRGFRSSRSVGVGKALCEGHLARLDSSQCI